MTALMKVLQIERVIPNLIDRRAIERTCANLELNHENDAGNQQHDINPPSHPRNAELKEDRAAQSAKALAQELNLRHPRIPLRLKHRKGAVLRESAENRLGGVRAEVVD